MTSAKNGQASNFTVVVIVILVIAIGVSTTVWQAVRANRAEQLAREEAIRATDAEKETTDTLTRVQQSQQAIDQGTLRATAAEDKLAKALTALEAERAAKESAAKDADVLATFLIDVLRSPDPTRDGREIKVVEILDNAAKKLETELSAQPQRRTKLQSTLADTYSALGLERQAIPLREKSRSDLVDSSGPEHADTLAETIKLAQSYRNSGRLAEALQLFEEALLLSRKLLGQEHPDTLSLMGDLAMSYAQAGRLDEALKLREEVVKQYRKVLGPEHLDTLRAMSDLASSYAQAHRLDEALVLREQVLKFRRKLLGAEHPQTLRSIGDVATSYAAADRLDEALRLREQLVKSYRKVLGPEHPDRLRAMSDLGDSYSAAGRANEAAELRKELVSLYRKVYGQDHPLTRSEIEKATGNTKDSAAKTTPAISSPKQDGAPMPAETTSEPEAASAQQSGAKNTGDEQDVSLQLPGIPDWLKTHPFPQKAFTFVRIQWGDDKAERWKRWMTDYPNADINLAKAVGSVTNLDVSTPSLALKLTDPRLADYPFIYIAEPGSLTLSDAETTALRNYLNGGGFLMVDDFWGEQEWANLRAVMKKVFPDRESQNLKLDHPLFHCVFDLKEKPQVPAIAAFMSGRVTERPGTNEAIYHAIVDDDDRVMVVMCQNTDLADGWERFEDDEKYRTQMSEAKAFPMGINIVFYALRQGKMPAVKAAANPGNQSDASSDNGDK